MRRFNVVTTLHAIRDARAPWFGADERITLVMLAAHADDEGIAWPSQLTLAAETGRSERRIRDTLKTLVLEGVVHVVRAAGQHHTARYSLLDAAERLGTREARPEQDAALETPRPAPRAALRPEQDAGLTSQTGKPGHPDRQTRSSRPAPPAAEVDQRSRSEEVGERASPPRDGIVDQMLTTCFADGYRSVAGAAISIPRGGAEQTVTRALRDHGAPRRGQELLTWATTAGGAFAKACAEESRSSPKRNHLGALDFLNDWAAKQAEERASDERMKADATRRREAREREQREREEAEARKTPEEREAARAYINKCTAELLGQKATATAELTAKMMAAIEPLGKTGGL